MAKKNKSLFPLLFSDLMMGAMGVIIVLLVFLQIVIIRGLATNHSVSEIRLPPGLEDKAAMPLTRIRGVVCGEEAASVKPYWGGNGMRSYSMDDNSGCQLWNLVLKEGLDNKELLFKATKTSDKPLTLSVTLTIGGFIASPAPFEIKKSIENEPLVVVSLKDPRVVYEY